MRSLVSSSAKIICISCFSLSANAVAAAETPSKQEVINPYADVRYRLEFVDQDGMAHDAVASTARVRVGVVTAELAGFSLVGEVEGIKRLGPEHYNDTVNGRTAYPVVADPQDLLLNRAFLRWHKGKAIDAAVGRQTVNYDNQRWVGSVNWRQNDQTLDAVTLQVAPTAKSFATYAYVWRVNRVFGPDSVQGTWRKDDIHLLRAGYNISPAAALTGYAYWLDIPDAPAMSSRTFGARLTGAIPISPTAKVTYAAEYAGQSDHGRNPRSFTHHYLLLEPGIVTGPWTAKLGLERLSGDGTTALQTPLATLHAFNGWADKFLTTPTNGLSDAYIDVGYTVAGKSWWGKTAIRLAAHDFRSTRSDIHYGREFDVSLAKPLNKWLTGTIKGAHYDARNFATDTTKLWFQLDAKF